MCPALRAAFGPASGGTGAGGGAAGLMPEPGTYQTRISDYRDVDRLDGDATLAAYGELYGRVQRQLFAAFAAGRSVTSLEGGVPAGVRDPGTDVQRGAGVVGGEDSIGAGGSEAAPGHPAAPHSPGRAADFRCLGAEPMAAGPSEAAASGQPAIQAGRIGSRFAAGRVRLCFGSKRLWRKQHHLETNGYASHEEWLADWRGARSGEFFVLGSRDETGGCQLCVAAIADDGSLALRLRIACQGSMANIW